MMSFFCSWERASHAGSLALGLTLLSGLGLVACSGDETEPSPTTGGRTGSVGGAGTSTGGRGGGGSGGLAGSSGTGGAIGAGRGSSEPTVVHTFDTSVEGFRINYICTGLDANGMATCMPITVPAPALGGDAGTDAGDAAPPSEGPPAEPDNGLATVSHDPALGDPQPGSIKIDIDFTAAGQLAVLALNFDSTDLTNKSISARVRVEAGAPPQVGGKLYIKTGENYIYADSGQLTLTPGTWMTLSYLMPSFVADAAMYNVADVREVGIEFAIPAATTFTPAVIHVDTFQY